MSRTRRKERASEEEVEEMPALLTTKDVAYITGWSRVFISKECREGMFKDLAVKCGNSWTFNKTKLLQAFGMSKEADERSRAMSKEADERSRAMSKNDRTYQREDVMQALVTALVFGEKAGLAAAAEYDEEPGEKVVELHPEGGSVVQLTAAAAEMLAEAQVILFDSREEGLTEFAPNRIKHYLLAIPDDVPVEIDMSEVTPGNTEKVYTDQPIPEREA